MSSSDVKQKILQLFSALPELKEDVATDQSKGGEGNDGAPARSLARLVNRRSSVRLPFIDFLRQGIKKIEKNT